MKKKLSQVLLIDDSKSDNFIHARRIMRAGVAECVVTKENGLDALDYLREELPLQQYQKPELIFLDINMPVMDGWEFLEAYDDLLEEQKATVVLAMLTTSTALRDRKRAEGFSTLSNFLEKPLTKADLASIIHQHFPELEEE